MTQTGRPALKHLVKRGLEWFGEGDNADYFAPEALRLSEAEVHAYSDAAGEVYSLLLEAVQKVAAKGLWDAAGIPPNAVAAVQHSLRHEWGNHLVGRFDFAGGLDGTPIKMLEFNGDTLSLMPETASIQKTLLDELPRQERKTAWQWNKLVSELTKGFVALKQRYRGKQPYLLLIGMGHEEDWLNLDVIERAAEKAGFEEIHRASLGDVIFSEEEGIFLEVEPDVFLQYDFVFKMVPWDYIANEEPELMDILTKIIARGLATIINPAYSMLLQSKALLPLLPELGLQHPALLRAARHEAAFPDLRYAEKPIYGRTGDNVRLFDGSRQPIAANDGDFGGTPKMYQELAVFDIDSDGDRYQPSVFMASGEACALCFRRQDGLIVDDDAEFVAHYIMP